MSPFTNKNKINHISNIKAMQYVLKATAYGAVYLSLRMKNMYKYTL